MYALNLTQSPEKAKFRDCADPLIIGAGNTGGALSTSADRHPGVADIDAGQHGVGDFGESAALSGGADGVVLLECVGLVVTIRWKKKIRRTENRVIENFISRC